MEKNFKRILVTTALPYANGRYTSDTWPVCMYPPIFTPVTNVSKAAM